MYAVFVSLLINSSYGQSSDNSSNAQSNQTRTFLNCYVDIAQKIALLFEITPSNIDPKDPEIKTLITNMCNFYHEKSGQWIDLTGEFDDIVDKYRAEFIQKYQNTFPETVKQFLQMKPFE
jgi:hypothetical protein